MSRTSLDHPQSRSAPWRRGVTGASTLMPAIIPLGIALGVALGAMSIPAPITWLSAPLMVAGSAQLVVFSQLESGSGFLAAGAAAVLLNSRFIVYGAALSHRFGPGQPVWFRLIGPHYIVDQTYAMATASTTTGVRIDDSDEDFRRYFVTAGTLLWIVWSCSVGVGMLAGPVLPSQLPLEFVLSATFVALIIPGLSRSSEVAAVTAGAVVAVPSIGSTTTLGVAAGLGALIGWSTTRSIS